MKKLRTSILVLGLVIMGIGIGVQIVPANADAVNTQDCCKVQASCCSPISSCCK